MGLDTVEIVMTIEETFKISISDDQAAKCKTIGDLTDVVMALANPQAGDYCKSSRAFYTLRKTLLEILPVDRKDIHPSTQWEALIPRNQRKAVWKQLKDRGINLPRLEPSSIIYWSIAVILFVPFALLAHRFGSWWPVWLGILPPVISAEYLTRPIAVRAPSTFKTVGGAALFMADSLSESTSLNRIEVREGIRRIISEQCDIPIEELTDDTKCSELE